MADNVTISEGAGKTIRTSEIGGTQHQHVHLTHPTTGTIVSAAAPLPITPSGAATATLANVSSSLSSVTLQAANTGRRALIIVNDSTANLFVKYGSPASATSYTYLLLPGDIIREEVYTGIVTGIWAVVNGAARVTELTA